jgi:hypothetical protein
LLSLRQYENQNFCQSVPPAVRRGGYIPHLDHACPANVPLENYRHYIMMKREIIGCGGGVPAGLFGKEVKR